MLPHNHQQFKDPSPWQTHPYYTNKRELLAEAAQRRERNWRQKLNPVTSRDRLLSNIQDWYQQRNQTPPLGLASCNVDQLKLHYQAIKKRF